MSRPISTEFPPYRVAFDDQGRAAIFANGAHCSRPSTTLLTALLHEACTRLDDACQTASAVAHRACCGTEHDPANGKLHGYCVVCGVPWPCDTARRFL